MPAYESELVFASPVPTQRPWLGVDRDRSDRKRGESSRSGDQLPALAFPDTAVGRARVERASVDSERRYTPADKPAPPPEFDHTGSR